MEEVANHHGLESCVLRGNPQYEALTEEHVGRRLSSENFRNWRCRPSSLIGNATLLSALLQVLSRPLRSLSTRARVEAIQTRTARSQNVALNEFRLRVRFVKVNSRRQTCTHLGSQTGAWYR
jgi:hypothetical protein